MKLPKFLQGRIDRDAEVKSQQQVAGIMRAAISNMSGLPQQIGMNVVPMSYPAKSPAPYPLYAFDTPILYATPQSPKRRPGSILDVQTLRIFADTYDVLRSCINHLKREVQSVPIEIVAKDTKDDSPATVKRIAEAGQYFGRNGGLGGPGRRRSHFESEIIEDICIIGAGAMYHQTDLVGRPLETIAIDAATIRPRVDAWGWADDIAYEQWIQGVLIRGFTREQLTYDGIFPVSYSPYFRSQVEWLVQCIVSAIKADEWNRTWLTDGTTPSDLIALPDDWTVEQIQTFSTWFDSLLAGNIRERQKTRFVPAGSQKVGTQSRKDQEFQEFELWLLRRTCSIMGVQPASIGYVGEQYKVSQDASMSQTTQFGAGALLDFRKENYDDLLDRMGYGDLQVRNVSGQEEDQLARAQRLQIAAGGPWLTMNEARAEDGLDPVPDGDTIRNTETPEEDAVEGADANATKDQDAARWQRKALKALKDEGSAAVPFTSPHFATDEFARITASLGRCKSADDVKTVFARLKETLKAA